MTFSPSELARRAHYTGNDGVESSDETRQICTECMGWRPQEVGYCAPYLACYTTVVRLGVPAYRRTDAVAELALYVRAVVLGGWSRIREDTEFARFWIPHDTSDLEPSESRPKINQASKQGAREASYLNIGFDSRRKLGSRLCRRDPTYIQY